jgi:hypothetical protein
VNIKYAVLARLIGRGGRGAGGAFFFRSPSSSSVASFVPAAASSSSSSSSSSLLFSSMVTFSSLGSPVSSFESLVAFSSAPSGETTETFSFASDSSVGKESSFVLMIVSSLLLFVGAIGFASSESVPFASSLDEVASLLLSAGFSVSVDVVVVVMVSCRYNNIML